MSRGCDKTSLALMSDAKLVLHEHLISYDGPEEFDAKNQQYWDSPARRTLGVDPDEYLESTQEFSLEPV